MSNDLADFLPGDQIAYVPTHAMGDIDHPDVEFGFVTSTKGDTVYCRYWSKYSGGLRTVSNSEGTPAALLVRHVSRRQAEIQRTLESIYE